MVGLSRDLRSKETLSTDKVPDHCPIIKATGSPEWWNCRLCRYHRRHDEKHHDAEGDYSIPVFEPCSAGDVTKILEDATARGMFDGL